MTNFMAYDDPEEDDDDWGQPPAPPTPENLAKAKRAQRILLLVGGIGVVLPAVLYFLIYGPAGCGISV
jgi:hypothetical protein